MEKETSFVLGALNFTWLEVHKLLQKVDMWLQEVAVINRGNTTNSVYIISNENKIKMFNFAT
jgi:hypothetical protein